MNGIHFYGEVEIRKNGKLIIKEKNLILNQFLENILVLLMGGGIGYSIYRLAVGSGNINSVGKANKPAYDWNFYTELKSPLLSLPLETIQNHEVPSGLLYFIATHTHLEYNDVPFLIASNTPVPISEIGLIFGTGTSDYQNASNYLGPNDRLITYKAFDVINFGPDDYLDFDWNIYIGKAL